MSALIDAVAISSINGKIRESLNLQMIFIKQRSVMSQTVTSSNF